MLTHHIDSKNQILELTIAKASRDELVKALDDVLDLTKSLVPGEFQHFENEDIEKAREWLK